MDTKLTKDSDYLICLLYKVYVERLKNGIPKSEAKIFDGAEYIQAFLIPQYSTQDISETCKELADFGFIENSWADNEVDLCWITTSAIVYMENRFKNNIMAVLEHISKIRSALF